MSRNTGLTMFVLVVAVFTLSSFAYASLSDGLIAYYPFNGNANDESGNGIHGDVYGATPVSDRFGISNSAYSFDGNDYIKVSNYNEIPTKHEISVGMWIKPNFPLNSSTSTQTFICNDWGFYHMSYRGGRIDFEIYDQNHKGYWYKYYENIDTSWHHLAFTVKVNDNAILYLDGDPHILGVTPATLDDVSNVLFIGSIPYLNEFVNGTIDEVRIYNRVLSESEIKSLATPISGAVWLLGSGFLGLVGIRKRLKK